MKIKTRWTEMTLEEDGEGVKLTIPSVDPDKFDWDRIIARSEVEKMVAGLTLWLETGELEKKPTAMDRLLEARAKLLCERNYSPTEMIVSEAFAQDLAGESVNAYSGPILVRTGCTLIGIKVRAIVDMPDDFLFVLGDE